MVLVSCASRWHERSRSSSTRRSACDCPSRAPHRASTSRSLIGSGPTTSTTPPTRGTWRSKAAATPITSPAGSTGSARADATWCRSRISSASRRRRSRQLQGSSGSTPRACRRRAVVGEPHHGVPSAWFQRAPWRGNDRLERVFRRHPAVKQRTWPVLPPQRPYSTRRDPRRRRRRRARGALRRAEPRLAAPARSGQAAAAAVADKRARAPVRRSGLQVEVGTAGSGAAG